MTVSQEQAVDNGFAGFNNCPHLCVDVPDGWFTITTKDSKGTKVTFAFCKSVDGKGHQCVDIVHHTGKVVNGVPVQRAAFLGKGPTNAVCNYNDETPTTLIALNLSRSE